MSDREESNKNIPPCKFRRRIQGMDMCYAIGCCEVGDMACECYDCDRAKCEKRTEGLPPSDNVTHIVAPKKVGSTQK